MREFLKRAWPEVQLLEVAAGERPNSADFMLPEEREQLQKLAARVMARAAGKVELPPMPEVIDVEPVHEPSDLR